VQVSTHHDGTTHTLCTPVEFLERLADFQELYQRAKGGSGGDNDPFSALTHLPILQGVGRLYVRPLLYLLDKKRMLPLVGPDGGLRVQVLVTLAPSRPTPWPNFHFKLENLEVT